MTISLKSKQRHLAEDLLVVHRIGSHDFSMLIISLTTHIHTVNVKRGSKYQDLLFNQSVDVVKPKRLIRTTERVLCFDSALVDLQSHTKAGNSQPCTRRAGTRTLSLPKRKERPRLTTELSSYMVYLRHVILIELLYIIYGTTGGAILR